MSFTAVITGASKGIGLDLAQRLLAITGFTYLANADDLKHRNQETAHQAVIIDHQHGLLHPLVLSKGFGVRARG